MKKTILLIISLTINALLLLGILIVCCIRTDILNRINNRINPKTMVEIEDDEECVKSWNNSIQKLHQTFDVVFFGNSITAGGDFQKAFPSSRSINMGYIGENTKGMLRRVEAIKSVNPKKVFIMAGINGLMQQSIKEFESRYVVLVDSIYKAVPHAEIYLESILPASSDNYECDNKKIREVNKVIERIAIERNIVYIDLYSLYAKEGALPQELTYDGLHLTEGAYEIWYEAIKEYVENQ